MYITDKQTKKNILTRGKLANQNVKYPATVFVIVFSFVISSFLSLLPHTVNRTTFRRQEVQRLRRHNASETNRHNYHSQSLESRRLSCNISDRWYRTRVMMGGWEGAGE